MVSSRERPRSKRTTSSLMARKRGTLARPTWSGLGLGLGVGLGLGLGLGSGLGLGLGIHEGAFFHFQEWKARYKRLKYGEHGMGRVQPGAPFKLMKHGVFPLD